jgi:hypothetical protein
MARGCARLSINSIKFKRQIACSLLNFNATGQTLNRIIFYLLIKTITLAGQMKLTGKPDFKDSLIRLALKNYSPGVCKKGKRGTQTIRELER